MTTYENKLPESHKHYAKAESLRQKIIAINHKGQNINVYAYEASNGGVTFLHTEDSNDSVEIDSILKEVVLSEFDHVCISYTID